MKLKENKGTIVVEMCVVMPIVVVVVMMAIHMMIIQINRSAAVGTLYVTSCSRSAVLTAKGSAEEELSECMNQSVTSYMQFANSISTNASYKKDNQKYISGIEGTLTLSILYESVHPGMALLLKTENQENSVTMNKRIRSTEDNLRRWQMYGSVL